MLNDEQLIEGVYETLLDEELEALIVKHPELLITREAIEDEATPHAYSQLVQQILHRALRGLKKERKRDLVNRLISLISEENGLDHIQHKRLLDHPKALLREISQQKNMPSVLPATPISVSSLFTGASGDPALEHELRAEMSTADSVDILISFIKWSGLRLLIPTFEVLAEREVPVRIVTTSYMGASDPEALERLVKYKNVTIRMSYDTQHTRLHAKAYHFIRNTGFSTAYIGSANMSRAAMTSGLEWTVKVTAQDMPHILDRFSAEFETYWSREEFEIYNEKSADKFRQAIQVFKAGDVQQGPRFFVDITPRDFQERILESLAAARSSGSFRNLVVAATGTGKTVVSAFDFARYLQVNDNARLLFIAHRKEILEQSLDCFRMVLRDANFGELMVGGSVPTKWNHVFSSIQSWKSQKPWNDLGTKHFDFVIVDEAHHGAALSYRTIFENLEPTILLGLTATPERMDGSNIFEDFDNRLAAEIRLPEALEEKLLCPFHYFGVTDPISIADDSFWRNGRYDANALTNIYTGDDICARQRLNAIFAALEQYQPNTVGIRGVGFCASVVHAEFMSNRFNEVGILAATVLGNTNSDIRKQSISDFRSGKLQFLFTVDVLSEGLDVPEINLVMFLRPTESLTVFLQQLGRGLRHAQDKDCLTVLDFVGQVHRKYRADKKFSALLPKIRRRIDKEIEQDFPNLPSGCSIQLERVARQHVLDNIRQGLGNLKAFIPETIKTFEHEERRPLSFGNFVDATGISPLDILRTKTWTQWKVIAGIEGAISDPDLPVLQKTLRRVSLRTDSTVLEHLENITNCEPTYPTDNRGRAMLHYLLWGKSGGNLGINTYEESFEKLLQNHSGVRDLREVVEWRKSIHTYPIGGSESEKDGYLRLHAAYGSNEIKAAFGLADINSAGMTGTGVLHVRELKTYLHLVTFRKEDADFSPTTRYQDYPTSRTLLHWESQSGTSQTSPTGKNYIEFKERDYRILFFARLNKRELGETVPFVFLGAADNLKSYKSNRPIEMVWQLENAMPAALFEEARAV